MTDKNTETKNKIFTTAAQLFSQKGFNGVSMRELSEKSGVSKPTIYYYFENKEELYKELVLYSITTTIENVEKIYTESISAKEKLVKIVKQFFHKTLETPEYIKFVWSQILFQENLEFLSKIHTKFKSEKFQFVHLILKEGKESGEFGPTLDIELGSAILHGSMSHYAAKQFGTKKILLTDELAEKLVDTLFKGLNE